jgi:hypothetical protein
VEGIDAAIARQWHGKHVSAAANTDTTIEDAVLSVWSVMRSNYTSQ